MGGPLEGIRVLDFTRFQQGPFSTVLLSDLGADVIKVEQPGGDPGRRLSLHEDGYSSYFEALNRNKRSIVIDLSHPDGRQVVYRLVSTVDVVTENFRPGTMEKLGLGYETLKEINPGLVYASASMFGPLGSRARHPGYDTIAQAVGGIMMATRRGDDPPQSTQGGLADQVGAMMLAHGVLAALLGRERNGGRGQKVDVSLYGSQLALQGIHITRSLYQRAKLLPPGVASGTFSGRSLCSDGRWIAYGYLDARLWPALCRALDLTELATDPRFATPAERGRNQPELVRLVDEQIAKRPAQEWIERLVAEDIPCTVIQDYEMVASDPQAQANNYITTYEHPWFGEIKASGPVAIFDQTPSSVRRHAPLWPGEHSEEVLRESGFSDAEIAELMASAVVRSERDKVKAT